MDYITVFPPVDGQTEFCGNLIILSPGVIISKTNIIRNSESLLIQVMLQIPRQRTTIHLSTRGACYHNLPHKRVSQLIKFHHFYRPCHIIIYLVTSRATQQDTDHDILRFGSAKGFSAVYYRIDPEKLLFNALTLPVDQNINL